MASIQQSLNQMLQTAQIGVGLYAQSPEGRATSAAIRAKRAKAIADDPLSSEGAKKVAETVGKEAAEKAVALAPTAERAEMVAKYRTQKPEGEAPETVATGKTSAQGFGSAGKTNESKLIRSLYERGETLSNQKQVVKDRISILSGEDNSIWEEYLNG